MAMSADTTWEIQTGGNDTNGGGFVTGAAGTNYSLNAGKNVATGTDDSTTDVVTNGTATITSATANFQASIVGNVIYLQGGTGAVVAARYRVLTRTNATTIVLDRATGLTAGTGVTMNVGGAFASLGAAFSGTATIPVTSNKFFIKSGTYTIASASTNIATGCVSTSLAVYIKGYQTTREDLGTPPLLQASGISTFTVINMTGSGVGMVKNISVDGAGLTSSRGFANGGTSSCTMWYCNALNCTNNGFQSNSIGSQHVFCTATGCSTQPAFNPVNAYGCIAFSNTVTGFNPSTSTRVNLAWCISYANSGATSDGFSLSGNQATLMNCVAYNNGRHGFLISASPSFFQNCIAEGHTAGWGWTHAANETFILQSCAGFDNNSGNVNPGTSTFHQNNNFVTGSASFFNTPGSGDFSLNNTAGGGAAARELGLPGVYPGGLTTSYLDIGAAQHQGAAGGGGEHSAVF